MSVYWRVRLKVRSSSGDIDMSRRAWDRDEVGIWYGAWTPKDLEAANLRSSNTKEIASCLTSIHEQRDLGWEVAPSHVDTARRFKDISDDDWVVLYLNDTREIGLAKAKGPLCFDPAHPLNCEGEIFKFRKLSEKKTFQLIRLPDAYRLLAAQGRSNVHQFHNMSEHVKLLAENLDEDGINRAFSLKPFDELLDVLGASAWESFCFAYLIWEEGFVPTGLSIGRTLPTVDIIGRRRNGSRILAQCKKHPTKQPIDPDFEILADSLAPEDSAFYFAYGGCNGKASSNVKVIDRHAAIQWTYTENGQLYRRLLLGDGLKQ